MTTVIIKAPPTSSCTPEINQFIGWSATFSSTQMESRSLSSICSSRYSGNH